MSKKMHRVSYRLWPIVALLWAASITGAHAQGFGAAESFVEIHGYVDLTYFDYQKNGDPDLPFADGSTISVPPGGGVSTFDNNHVTLFFGANLSQNLKAVTEFHYEHSINEPELPQANIQWQLAKPLTVVFGRYWLPFGTLGKHRIYQPTNNLVSYPYPVSQALPFHNAQNGIKLTGDIHPFMYELSLSNGFAGLDEDAGKRVAGLARDNNQNKAFTGRVMVYLLGGIELGGSYYTGKWDDNNKASISFWGADADYAVGPLMLQAEYLGGRLQNPAGVVATVDGEPRGSAFTCPTELSDPGAGPIGGRTSPLCDNMGALSPGNHSRTAYYGQAALRILKNKLGLNTADLIVRYDVFKRDETKNLFPGEEKNYGDRARFTAGINISPQPHFHLKAEYQSVSEPGKQLPVRNNGVMAQAVVDF